MPKRAKLIMFFMAALVVVYVIYNIFIHSYLSDIEDRIGGIKINLHNVPSDKGSTTTTTKAEPKQAVVKNEKTGKDQIFKVSEYNPVYEQFIKSEITSEYHPSSFMIAIVATKRPYYLEATLRSLQQVLYYNKKNTIIYQYGDDKVIGQIARKYDISMVNNPVINIYEGRPLTEGAEHISLHYKFIIGHMFRSNSNIKHFIIVEDDMLFSPDFLLYFAQTAKYIHQDSSIYAISAYNDNGMQGKVKYDNLVYRTDFMIGLGWLVSRRIWEDEWQHKWPRSHWDHFLRADNNRRGRQIIFPEVPRIYHSGYTGTHSTVALYERYFRNHLLNPNGFAPLGIGKEEFQNGKYRLFDLDRTKDKYTLDYLLKDNYSKFMRHMLTKHPDTIYLNDPDEIINYKNKNIVMLYRTDNPSVNNEWVAISEYFELWHSIPIRDEYEGIMLFRWSDNLVFIVSSYSFLFDETALLAKAKLGDGFLSPITAFQKDSNWNTPKKESIITFGVSNQGQSCSAYCQNTHKMPCYRFSFEEMNSCKFMKKYMDECTQCFGNSGADQPAMDVESKQCLYNGGGRGRFMSTCEAFHPKTKRLCPCFDEERTSILRQEWEDIIAQSQRAAVQIEPIIA